jgi:hypothetical protein
LREAIQEGRDDVLIALQAVEAARDGYKELSEGQASVIKNNKAKIAELEQKLKDQKALHASDLAGLNQRLEDTDKKHKDEVTGLKKEITKLRSAKKKP